MSKREKRRKKGEKERKKEKESKNRKINPHARNQFKAFSLNRERIESNGGGREEKRNNREKTDIIDVCHGAGSTSCHKPEFY